MHAKTAMTASGVLKLGSHLGDWMVPNEMLIIVMMMVMMTKMTARAMDAADE